MAAALGRLKKPTVLLCVLLGCITGYCAEAGLPSAAMVLTAVQALPWFLFLRSSSVEFGRPCMLPQQVRLEVMASFLLQLPLYICFMSTYHFPQILQPVGMLSGVVAMIMAMFTFASRFCLVYSSAILVLFAWGQDLMEATEHRIPKANPYGCIVVMVYYLTAIFTMYKKDMCSVVAVGITSGICHQVGSGLYMALQVSDASGIESVLTIVFAISNVFVGAISVYGYLFWARRFRRLPPGLQGCKFVRLSYLRSIAAEGSRIRRCQELPPEAFGDPWKARYFLVISHRWLDRYTCDVCTPDYPGGLRLHTMLRKLEAYFSPQAIGRDQTMWERFELFCSGFVGGRDVLVFFDFMSLPQVGMDSQGNLLQRTAEEQAVFDRCLPNMGVLYSMFPVMICDEVPEGSTTYDKSGWCFSEVSIASLGGQLDAYSCEALRGLRVERPPQHLKGAELEAFVAKFNEALLLKSFFNASDRSIVGEIFQGFLRKSRLVSAIRDRDLEELKAVLLEIDQSGFHSTLNQPVDSCLNTPLHLTVAIGFWEACEELLRSGADPGLRNLRGDVSTQWFLFPRINQAARFMRRRSSRTTVRLKGIGPSASTADPSLGSFRGHGAGHSSQGEAGGGTAAAVEPPSAAAPVPVGDDFGEDSDHEAYFTI